jgi:hypothetical protein
MRQPTTTPLQAIVAAIPDDRLRPLLMELLQNGAAPKALPAQTPATPMPTKRRGGWPAGRKRGRPSKTTTAKAAAALARQRLRDAEKKREKRAAAQPAKPEATTKSNGNGGGNGTGAAITPAAIWEHAKKINPKSPWRALRDFEVNDQVALDAFRAKVLPPGFGAEAAAKFLEISVS